MQNLQIPVTAESIPLAWIFAKNHNRRDRLTSRPDAILVTPKKTCDINQFPKSTKPSQWSRPYFKEWKEGGIGLGARFFSGSHHSWRQTPSPATAYRPRQTRPKNLPWQRCTTHLIEIKYFEDTRPEQQLQAAHAHHGHHRRSIAGDHVLRVILLGVGGVVYIPHTLVPLKSLGLDLQSQETCSQTPCSFCALCS